MSLDIRGAEGYLWEITRRGHGRVLALSQSPQAQNALRDSRTWTASATATPAGANNYFFYMMNTSQSVNLVISRIAADVATAEEVVLNAVTGTAAAGTALTPLNRTRGSAKQPTSATVQSGTNITGLTSSGTLERLRLLAATRGELLIVDRPIVLLQGQAVGMLGVAGSIAINFQVDFYEDLSDPQVVT